LSDRTHRNNEPRGFLIKLGLGSDKACFGNAAANTLFFVNFKTEAFEMDREGF
jgi:hypothetical protein